ncbi:MAG: hypothetical protein AB1351_12775, partial [Thermoproteota archaeon]
MLGGKSLRETIQENLGKLHEDLSIKIDKKNPDTIHAAEACGCTRFAYYERKDPVQPDSHFIISNLLVDGMRKSLTNKRGEYKVDSLSLEVNADLIMADEYVVRFEVV